MVHMDRVMNQSGSSAITGFEAYWSTQEGFVRQTLLGKGAKPPLHPRPARMFWWRCRL